MSTEAVFSVSENVSEQERCCVAVFAAGDIRREIAVRQKGREHLRVRGGRRMTVSCLPSAVSVELDCNVNYEVEIPDSSGSWIIRRKTGLADILDNRTAGIVYGGLRLDVAYNESESERTAAVVFFNSECGVSDTLHIVQTGSPGFCADGQSVCIQNSDDGGADIVLMGYGFTLEGLSIGGCYDSIMRQAARCEAGQQQVRDSVRFRYVHFVQ